MYQLAIFKNETHLDHLLWVEACEKKKELIAYDIIDATSNNWMKLLNQKNYDLIILRPPGRIERFKRLYDERTYILSHILKKKVYPSPEEVYIYENKRFLRDWLDAHNIPHPITFIFYDEKEALLFGEKTLFPIVAKTNIGASGKGVEFLNNYEELKGYIKKAFSNGVKLKIGSKLFKGSLLKKLKKVIRNKKFISQRINDYSTIVNESQKGFIILQEFIPHAFEWRCVRIGDSFFAHKKIARNNMSSGTLIKGYDPVPKSLLDFIREITNKANLSSVSIDVFEKDEHYLVNEIQCFFGQSDPYQMMVNGKPGRYKFNESKWLFEEGDFARNSCYDLRLEHAISHLREK